MKKLAVVLLLSLLVFAVLAPTAATADGGWRTWKSSYNGSTLHGVSDAAVPSKWLKPGHKARVCWPLTGKCITIKAHAGGCRCFDLSREGFNALSNSKHDAVSEGVITVKAKRL